MKVFKEDYNISLDKTGSGYLGLDLDWNQDKQGVHVSMLDYVAAACKRFKHEHPKKLQDQPYPHVNPKHGVKVQ